jgi:hypothetical protein
MPVVLGVLTIVSGVAAGLFSDLRLTGKIVGIAALALWFVALGSLLWGLGSERPPRAYVRIVTFAAFVLTAALLVIALQTGPRLNARTLVLSERGQAILSGLCPGAVGGAEVAARLALSQLDGEFVHIELEEARCPDGGRDIRIRSEDLLAVLPEAR